jgi:hypothetical protein
VCVCSLSICDILHRILITLRPWVKIVTAVLLFFVRLWHFAQNTDYTPSSSEKLRRHLFCPSNQRIEPKSGSSNFHLKKRCIFFWSLCPLLNIRWWTSTETRWATAWMMLLELPSAVYFGYCVACKDSYVQTTPTTLPLLQSFFWVGTAES